MRDLVDELLQAKVKARLFGGDRTVRLGRLVILERIGSGGMGAVYAAYDPRLDRRVAVKVLHAGDEASERVLAEARALAKLAHPNVVAIHDADEADGLAYIVMELATGTPLRAWMSKPRTWRDVVRVMREAAEGLAAAHRAGVLHRDIKPDNIIVGETTRIVDFGLAFEVEGAGTPNYMAPEVLAGGPATEASDQFGFGVTLFEAFYGQRPYAGATREELRRAALLASSARPGQPVTSSVENAPTEPDANRTVATGASPAATTRGPATQPPSWVHAIVKRALSADPAQRFASMGIVAAALARDRRRARVIAIAAAALVAGGVIGGIAMRRHATAHSCESTRLPSTWSWTRMQKITSALGDAPWVQASVDALDKHAKQWGATYQAVCAATRVRGAQSDRLLELRMRCLDRALDRFDALATALEAPLDSSPRAEAAGAIAQLPQPTACSTLVDAGELALPIDPAQRATAIALERASDRAWTDYALGRYREAREAVLALETKAAPLDAPGLQASLAVLDGAIESRIGEPAVGRARLERALAATAKAHAYELEYAVWTRMLRHELFAGNPARVMEWEKFGRAAALHAGLEGAELDGILGEALRDAGQPSHAREYLTRALASKDPLRKDQRAILEMNLGSVELSMGQAFLAEAAFTRALELARTQLGDGHPTLAIYRDKLAEADRARGRITSALAHHDASIALRTAAYGAEDRSVATARFHRAETLLEAGQLTKAIADLEAARAIRVKLLGERSPRLGEIDVVLGDVELARGNKAEAIALYDRAVALDPRLDVTWKRDPTPGRSPDTPAIEPFSVERAPMLAAWIRGRGLVEARVLAAAIANAARSAHTDDPTLALAAGDALTGVFDARAAEPFYRTALGALAKEPSRMRLHALRALNLKDEADALAKQMPELTP